MNPGTLINQRYRIVRSLGEGGMANVYLAHDEQEDRDVAIKVLRLDLQDNPEFVRRFQREAQAATNLTHPNIVKIIDAGQSNGLQFLVMEYVAGDDLKTYIRDHFPIPYQQVVDIMMQLLSAVDNAHDHGIVHRDLKPQNVLIDADGNVKITDFGIALARSEFGMTQTNTVLGSVHYLSPEQTRGGIATNKSDIYSLGIILYELLTGKVPFDGETPVAIAVQHSQSQVPSVREFDPNIPQALENVITRATAKDPDNRYFTAGDMANDLSTTLSPRRADEPALPPFQDNNDATRVISMDQLNAQVASGISNEPVTATTTLHGMNEQQAMANQAVDETNYPKKRKRWPWVIVGLIVLSLAVIMAAMFSPGRVSVPNVSDLSQSQARRVIEQNDLKVGTVSKTTSSTVAKGDVINTDPRAGKKVAKNSTINIIVSNGSKRVRFGDYVGESYATVSTRLERLGYTVRKVEDYSDSITSGRIIDQDVDPDQRVDPSETTVTFTVSRGAKKIEVPDFSGSDLSVVRSWADSNGVSVSVSEREDDSKTPGTVISTRPGSGSTMTSSGTLSVVVAKASGGGSDPNDDTPTNES